MLDLYSWATPNGRKVSIMLAETGLEHRTHWIDIGANAQFSPDFLKISPNNKVPAIVDRDEDGRSIEIFESGAILIYLAEKTGRFLPPKGAARAAALQWLMWQMSGLGPSFGQLYHFHNRGADREAYAVERFSTEAERLLQVMERRLGEAPYLAGEYSIADMAAYPWITLVLPLVQSFAPELGLQHVHEWCTRLQTRPAVAAGMAARAPL